MPTEWEADCLHWRGRVLTGTYGHWCAEWDELPVDETCPEWPCGCFPDKAEPSEDAEGVDGEEDSTC